MKYDKYTKLVEKVILLLHELRPSDHLTYSDLLPHFPNETRSSLMKVLEAYEYDFLFSKDCECNRGKGRSMENMFLLSVDGERLVVESETWKGRLTFSFKKPLKLYCLGYYFKRLRSPTATLLLVLWTLITTSTSIWLTYKQTQNEEINNIDSKRLEIKDDTIANLKRIIDSLRVNDKKGYFAPSLGVKDLKEQIVYSIRETDSLFSDIKIKRFQLDVTNVGTAIADSVYITLRTFTPMEIGPDSDLRLIGTPYSAGDSTITRRYKKTLSLKPNGTIHIEMAMDANDFELHKKAFYRHKKNATIEVPSVTIESSKGFGKRVK